MTEQQKRLKDRMESEGGCTTLMTADEWNRKMNGGKSARKTPAKKTQKKK